jgi:hypothetical protein
MIQGMNPGRDKKLLSSPKCPYWLWSPPSLLSKEYQGCFPRGLRPATYVHLVLRLRMGGGILLLPLQVFMV